MFIPAALHKCVFMHNNQVYQMHYDDDTDDISYYCFDTALQVQDLDTCLALTKELIALSQAVLYSKGA
ncbi:hypothetical protein D3A86_02930 [Vibrio cholerae]|nr:hypothetical protein [Vibrio cholerae]MCD1217614.1 hypothetical protein [Vibrio cholerae]